MQPSRARYLLTDPRQLDILQSGPGWRESNAIRPIETPRVYYAARRRGGVAAPGVGAAARSNAARGLPGLWQPFLLGLIGSRRCGLACANSATSRATISLL